MTDDFMNICESCHAGCCRAFAVPLTGADILRIEREVGLGFWDFVCRWADGNGQIARNHAPHFYFSDEPETPFVICLEQEQSVFLSGTTKCRFLVECPPDDEYPLGLARCGIYGQRPATCRTFPTKLNDTSELAIIYDVPAHGRSGDQSAYSLCPRQWETSDVDAIDMIRDLVVVKYEMSFFRQLATVWNQVPRPWTMFPEFLRLVYSKRVVRETTIEATPEEEPVIPRMPTFAPKPLAKAA